MSVYTTVTESQLQIYLKDYSLGELVEFEGITDGIENTNYFVTTDKGEYVLTLFEFLAARELPFYIELMAFLNEHNIPSAHPVKNNAHSYLGELNHKPCILMQRLQGRSVKYPSNSQCAAIGNVLAELHLRGKYFEMYHENSRGIQWQNETGKKLLPLLSDVDADILKGELKAYAQLDFSKLPRGIIHADLFRDNVLFEQDQLTGVLDFYNACNDMLVFDLAITVNDWCVRETGELDMQRFKYLCVGYQSHRQLTAQEHQVLPVMLRIAGTRFWLSRLWSRYYPMKGELTFQKNPEEFKNIILARIQESNKLQSYLNAYLSN